MSQRTATFGETTLPVGTQDTIAEIRQAFAKFYPDVMNCQAILDDNNNVTFKAVGGSKGAAASTRTATFGETTLPVGTQDTIAEIRQAFAKFYPDVMNCQAILDDNNNVTFKAVGGSKGV